MYTLITAPTTPATEEPHFRAAIRLLGKANVGAIFRGSFSDETPVVVVAAVVDGRVVATDHATEEEKFTLLHDG